MSLRTRKISSLIIFVFCFFFAIAFIILTSKTGVKSLDDIYELKTNIEEIKAINTKRSISYDLKLNGYNNLFKIAADYQDLFDYQSLSSNVKSTDTLIFEIANKQVEKLNDTKMIQILGIKTKNRVFLNSQKTFEKDKTTRKYLAPLGGIGLILLSIGVYVYRRFFYKYDY